MEKRRLGDRLYLIPGSPNTLYYAEGRGLLVDPGIGEGRGEALAEMLGGRVDVVLTHGHTDHLAAAPSVARSVAAHRLCVTLVESMDARKALVYGGLVSDSFASMPRVELRVFHAFDWGEELAPGVYTVALPGHTPGHTGVLFEEEGVVAVGDALVGEMVLKRYGLPYALDAKRWVESLGVIEGLVERGYTLVPGHGPVLRGDRALRVIEANREAVLRAKGLVEELVSTPRSLDELAVLVTRSVAGRSPSPRSVALNRVTVSSILAWLEDEGRVEPVVEGNRVAWRLARR